MERIIKINDLPEWTRKPILVYGPRKGGTTLLQNLIDGNELILMYPDELKLKFYGNLLFEAQPLASKLFFEYSRIANKMYDGFDHVRYSELISEYSDNAYSLSQLMSLNMFCMYLSLKHKPKSLQYCGYKEVGGDPIRIIKLFRQLYFDGKIIMILREPKMVTRSVLLNRRRSGVKLGLRGIAKQVSDPIRVINKQMEFVGNPGIFALCYEDLVGGKINIIMRSLCEFLNVPYSEVMEYPTIFKNPVIVKTSSKSTHAVFDDDVKWYDSLSVKEIIIIISVNVCLFLLFKITRKTTEYAEYKSVRKMVNSFYMEGSNL